MLTYIFTIIRGIIQKPKNYRQEKKSSKEHAAPHLPLLPAWKENICSTNPGSFLVTDLENNITLLV